MSAQPDNNTPLLSIKNISKRLGGSSVLSAVDLSVAKGELIVLLGPNGAGKTTLLGTACGRLSPDTGTVELCGGNPRTDPAVRGNLGFVPQDLALYPYLSVIENLEVFGRMMGVSRQALPRRVSDALEWSGLATRSRDRVDILSGGMRRRLNIVASLLHEPSMLMLDEPTVGVDVNARERIHELLRQLRARGLGVLLTTHDLEQATALADRVIFLIDGSVRVAGSPAALINAAFPTGKELLVTFLESPTAAAATELRDCGLQAAHGGVTWSGEARGGYEEASTWTNLFRKLDLDVAELRIRKPSLEGVFLSLTGEELKL